MEFASARRGKRKEDFFRRRLPEISKAPEGFVVPTLCVRNHSCSYVRSCGTQRMGTQRVVRDGKRKRLERDTRQKMICWLVSMKTKSVQCLAIWTMNHVKQRVAKDMSAASELVRA